MRPSAGGGTVEGRVAVGVAVAASMPKSFGTVVRTVGETAGPSMGAAWTRSVSSVGTIWVGGGIMVVVPPGSDVRTRGWEAGSSGSCWLVMNREYARSDWPNGPRVVSPKYSTADPPRLQA